jgi:transposase-like protein
LEWQILRDITLWSGQVSVDEKWIKIKGTWYFVLCAVDSVSGFPLLMDLYPTVDTVELDPVFQTLQSALWSPRADSV